MESGLFILFGRIPAMGSGLFCISVRRAAWRRLEASVPWGARYYSVPLLHFFYSADTMEADEVYCVNIMKYKLTFIEMVEKQVYNLKYAVKHNYFSKKLAWGEKM